MVPKRVRFDMCENNMLEDKCIGGIEVYFLTDDKKKTVRRPQDMYCPFIVAVKYKNYKHFKFFDLVRIYFLCINLRHCPVRFHHQVNSPHK